MKEIDNLILSFFIIGIVSIKRKENLVKHALQIIQWQRGFSGLGD